jgi:hypothetical protein
VGEIEGLRNWGIEELKDKINKLKEIEFLNFRHFRHFAILGISMDNRQ